MGIEPMTLGLLMGGASALSTLVSGISGASSQRAQANAQAAQAQQIRNQTSVVRQQGQIEAEAIDKQKAALRRQYEKMQGENRVALGVGNVDPSSGSALDVADGNASLFAQDMAENSYQRALKQWETENQIRSMNAQADALDAQASYAKKSSYNLFPTILGAALHGTSSWLTGYTTAGGKLGSVK